MYSGTHLADLMPCPVCFHVPGPDFGARVADETPEIWRHARAADLLGHVGCAARRWRVCAQVVPAPMLSSPCQHTTHRPPCPHSALAPSLDLVEQILNLKRDAS